MSVTIDLTQGKWRLHTKIGVTHNWDQAHMGIPGPDGPNTDVLFTFKPESAQLAPAAPDGLEANWYRATFEPSPDLLDTEYGRGVHWVRVFPAIEGRYPFVQIVQMKYDGKADTLRIFVGRWVSGSPNLFFGHGTGNDGVETHTFTFRQE